MAITLPDTWPVVGVGILSLVFLNIFQIVKVSGARRVAKVAYPNLYASDAEAKADPAKQKFNCTQRAHANTLENVPMILALFSYVSVFKPEFATGALLLWVIGRLSYTINYSTGVPSARNNGIGAVSYLGLFGLLGSAIYTTVVQVKALNLF